MQFSHRKPHFWHPQNFAKKTLFWHNVTLCVFKNIPPKHYKNGETVKDLDQFLTLSLDQFLTLSPPNLGPVLTLQHYIYIYLYINTLSLSLWAYVQTWKLVIHRHCFRNLHAQKGLVVHGLCRVLKDFGSTIGKRAPSSNTSWPPLKTWSPATSLVGASSWRTVLEALTACAGNRPTTMWATWPVTAMVAETDFKHHGTKARPSEDGWRHTAPLQNEYATSMTTSPVERTFSIGMPPCGRVLPVSQSAPLSPSMPPLSCKRWPSWAPNSSTTMVITRGHQGSHWVPTDLGHETILPIICNMRLQPQPETSQLCCQWLSHHCCLGSDHSNCTLDHTSGGSPIAIALWRALWSPCQPRWSPQLNERHVDEGPWFPGSSRDTARLWDLWAHVGHQNPLQGLPWVITDAYATMPAMDDIFATRFAAEPDLGGTTHHHWPRHDERQSLGDLLEPRASHQYGCGQFPQCPVHPHYARTSQWPKGNLENWTPHLWLPTPLSMNATSIWRNSMLGHAKPKCFVLLLKVKWANLCRWHPFVIDCPPSCEPAISILAGHLGSSDAVMEWHKGQVGAWQPAG